MEAFDKILLGLLLLAIAAFPVAVFLYLRTAYRKGGWREVKATAIIALVAMLIPLGLRIWFNLEFRNAKRIIEHPFALGTIVLVLLMWLAHRALKTWAEEAHDDR